MSKNRLMVACIKLPPVSDKELLTFKLNLVLPNQMTAGKPLSVDSSSSHTSLSLIPHEDFNQIIVKALHHSSGMFL